MTKSLVLIESAGKIKKLESILGPDYKVMASMGHIMDLDRKTMSIDIGNNFEPKYTILQDTKKGFKTKQQIVNEIKLQAKKYDKIYLATDEDREGEMIAWCLAYVLNIKKPNRITFNSITKNEIMNAIKHPRDLDYNMIDAQKTRRILDRLIGFELSPLLWTKIGNGASSAGRVQSVVVKIIIDRENDITDFLKGENNGKYRITSSLCSKDFVTNATLYSTLSSSTDDIDQSDDEYNEDLGKYSSIKIDTKKDAKSIMNDIIPSILKICDIIRSERKREPAAPFITSTLQQDASQKLGFPVKKTMDCAQKLYESGYITYMRTDSYNLSKEAMDNIKKYISTNYGKEYSRQKTFKCKSKNSQEAHEAIRPTDIDVCEIEEDDKIKDNEIKLYNLIWRRTMASQMSPAIIDSAQIVIEISKLKKNGYYFVAKQEEIKFDGFLKVYNIDEDKDNVAINIPKIGTLLTLDSLNGEHEFNRPKERYNEASLVRKLENLGIGRPSTYAANIETIQRKGYVEVKNIDGIKKTVISLRWSKNDKDIKEEKKDNILWKEKNKLVPTDMGNTVTQFLEDKFPNIVNCEFTSKMENDLDIIANGKNIWYNVVSNFYEDFHPIVENIKIETKNISGNTNTNINNSRDLGIHPKNGYPVVAFKSKYGPVVKMIVSDAKSIYANIEKPYKLETIKLADAIKLFQYPKILGKYKDIDIIINKGKFGIYISYGNMNINVPDDHKDDIDIDMASELIDKKIEKNKSILWTEKDNNIIYSIRDNGKGKYICVMKSNAKDKKPDFHKIDQNVDIDTMTLQKIKNIIKGTPIKKTESKLSTKDNIPTEKLTAVSKKKLITVTGKPSVKKNDQSKVSSTKPKKN